MIRLDCRHYVGSKPCRHRRACEGCDRYEAIGERILVIKLGALGDLLRTTPILPSLRAAYPSAQLTWLTKAECIPLLDNLTEIDRLWVTDAHALSRVLAESFDLVVNFDKETPAAELATLARSGEKRGFGLTSRGALVALNAASEYSLRLGVDDDLKFRRNAKTYQALIHEMAELPLLPSPSGPDYRILLLNEEREFGRRWVSGELGARRESPRLLGVNPGAGKVFATKKWHPERYADVALRLYRRHGVVPLLLGGPDEAGLNDAIQKRLRRASAPVLRPGEGLELRQFLSVVAQCDGFVCGDTLGMHAALGLGVPTVAVFTSTCAQEIEFYGRGEAVIGSAPCAPCYLSRCRQESQWCSDSVEADRVAEALERRMGLAAGEELRRRSHV